MEYNGLSSKEVIINRRLYGSNKISKEKRKSIIELLINSLKDPIIKILLIALIIKLFFIFSKTDLIEAIGIFIAIFLSSLISTLSEYSSEKAFSKMLDESSLIKYKVYRDNKICEVYSDDIVVGDVIFLSSGDEVPADIKIIKGALVLDESVLTGESKEIYKNIDDLLYKGTNITSGNATGIIKSVGDNTMYGNISKEVLKESPVSTLKIRLYGLAKVISKIGYVGAFITSLSYIFNKVVIVNDFNIDRILLTLSDFYYMADVLIYALAYSVTIIIVAVPEGLPMMITLVLSSNMKRMVKDNVLVRRLSGIETSGNINVLLTDKTGTITYGVLKVEGIYLSNMKRYDKFDNIPDNLKDILYLSMCINNESIVNGKDIISSNQIDKALIEYTKYDYKDNINIIKREYFNSKNKYSSVYIDDYILYKGASEVLLNKCNKILDIDGNIVPINKYKYEMLLSRLTSKAYRVISLVKKENDDYIFIGFVSFFDDVRENSKSTIDELKKASIKVIMVTGDNKKTAISIAKKCNLLCRYDDIVLDSDEFNSMSDDEIVKKIDRIKVLSRALPNDKLRFVKILEDYNYVVGMTGDGVNDAPALKRANVGFALGSGSFASKEASDIIIKDDNIKSILMSILYGRTTLKSIRKFIVYQLTVNFTALFLSIIGSYIGFIAPITIIQMLWLNMIMDTFAALAFSFEVPLKSYMNEKPESINSSIINKNMYSQIIFLSIISSLICILFLKCPLTLKFINNDPKTFYTAYFALFIFIGIFNSYNARTERINILSNLYKNKVFIIISIFIIITQIYLIYYGGDIFRTYGLKYNELIFVIILAFIVIPLDILRKIIVKRMNN